MSGRTGLRAVPPPTAPRLLTIEQAAELLTVRPTTVRAWLRQQRLPRVKLGRSVRVPASAIAAFIEANTTPAV